MRLRQLVTLAVALGPITCAARPVAVSAPSAPSVAPDAPDPQAFLQREYSHLETLLQEPASPARDAAVDRQLDTFVDYDEMTRRTFGAPCPPSQPDCEDLWSRLDDAQKNEVGDLMKALARKACRKYLLKALDFDIAFEGTESQGSDIRVVTVMQGRSTPHDPPVRVDYVVRRTDKGFALVDFGGERSSITKNYYTQFSIRMHDTARGYPEIIARLHEKIAKKD